MELEMCYRVLGVRSDADLPEIKAAFRRLAREYHPDRNKTPEAEVQFNQITEAYDTILGSHGVAAASRAQGPKEPVDEDFGGKLSFTIFADKEVVHSVSPKLFEREIRKRFHPGLTPGTSCKIGRTWFEIDTDNSKKSRLFASPLGTRKILIEWYKTASGEDQWKPTTWDAFWNVVRRYASLASV